MDRRTFLGGSAVGVAALALGVGEAFASPAHQVSDAYLTVSNGRREVRVRPLQRVDAGGDVQYGARDDESPGAVAIDGDRLWVSDRGQGVVVALDASGRTVAVARGFAAPRGLAMSPVGLLVCDAAAHQLVVLDGAGRRTGTIGSAVVDGGTLNGPLAVAVDVRGHAHVCDAGSRTIQVFDVRTRELLGAYGHGRWPGVPRDIAITEDGRVHVVDAVGRAIHTFDAEGRFAGSTSVSGAPAAISAVGTSLNLWVA